MNKFLLVLLLALSTNAMAEDPSYVGGGRYYCKDCPVLDSIQNRDSYQSPPASYQQPVEQHLRDFNAEQDYKRDTERLRGQIRHDMEERDRKRDRKRDLEALRERAKTMTDAEKQAELERITENFHAEIEEINRKALEKAKRGY